ncbi:outer membrane protein [Novosphingobium nitrogenifigens]|nr:porin family protein [Novosphingobium nitrogenifigens]
MKKIAYLAATAAALVAANAHAKTFNGPFIGAQGGWEENSVNNPSTGVGPTNLYGTGDTGTLGVFVGQDYRILKNFVIGGQAEVNFPINSHITDGTTTVDPKRSVDLSLRAGYVLRDKTLLYVRGGYSNVRASTIINAETPIYVSGSQNGWMLGGGIEQYVTKHITGRMEYRYTNLSEGAGKFDRHQLLLGVAYHF